MPLTAVSDTNILFSATGWRGNPFQCVERARAREFPVFTCPELMEELAEKLGTRLHFSADQVAETLADYLGFLQYRCGKNRAKVLRMEQRLKIATAVYHAHDAHPRFRDAIKDEVFAGGKAAVGRPQLVAAAARSRVFSQYLEVVDEQVNEPVRRRLIIFRDALPDFEQVTPGVPGQAIRGHYGCWRRRRSRASRFSSSASRGKVASV